MRSTMILTAIVILGWILAALLQQVATPHAHVPDKTMTPARMEQERKERIEEKRRQDALDAERERERLEALCDPMPSEPTP